MRNLHIPELQPHECIPTQDAYDAAVRALEKHRERANVAEAVLAEIRDMVLCDAEVPDLRSTLSGIFRKAVGVVGER